MSQLTLMSKELLNKQGAQEFAEQIKTALYEGTVNPLELLLAFKTIEKAKEQVEAIIKTEALGEARKYSQKSFEYLGNTIEIAENLGLSYDYSQCGHLEYNELMVKFKKLEARKKEIEKELQAMKTKQTRLDEATGEVYEVYPPIKKSSEGVKITLK